MTRRGRAARALPLVYQFSAPKSALATLGQAVVGSLAGGQSAALVNQAQELGVVAVLVVATRRRRPAPPRTL